MQYRTMTAIGTLSFALAAATACTSDTNRDVRETTTATEPAREIDRAAEQQQERTDDIAKMDERVAELQRSYDEQAAARPRGTSGSTTDDKFHADVAKEMTDLKQAVSDLRTTTPENWWERHERALNEAADDIEADVRQMTGGRGMAPAAKADRKVDASGEPVSTAPFTSRRDKFAADTQLRIDGWKAALDKVNARGARETVLEDLKVRVNKLDDDIDHLKSASAEDWWDVTRSRVNDYIERVEKSVARLDDNK